MNKKMCFSARDLGLSMAARIGLGLCLDKTRTLSAVQESGLSVSIDWEDAETNLRICAQQLAAKTPKKDMWKLLLLMALEAAGQRVDLEG